MNGQDRLTSQICPARLTTPVSELVLDDSGKDDSLGIARAIAVLQPRQRFLESAASHVPAKVGLDLDRSAVVDKLVRSESAQILQQLPLPSLDEDSQVGLEITPRQINPLRPILQRPNAILPMIVADKVPSWPSQYWHLQLPILGDQLHDVFSPSQAAFRLGFEEFGGAGVGGVVDEATVDSSAELRASEISYEMRCGEKCLHAR